jgi:hypothetical protein
MATGSSSDSSGDRAYLYDSAGDDTFGADFWDGVAGKYGGGFLTDEVAGDPASGSYRNAVRYFDVVYARSSDSGTSDTIDVEDEELLAYRLIRSGTW